MKQHPKQQMSLIEALKDNSTYPFHMPGHKRTLADDELLSRIYGIDITEIEGFDDLHDAKGIIKEAEERAAALFSADETHFLVNGSTGGILAAIYGTVAAEDEIVIAANCHRSVYNAVMLSGAKLHLITPEAESGFGIFAGVEPGQVADALDDTDPNVRTAVVITSPTYEGITSDISAIAKVCRSRNATLIVDAAHGAHFGFSDDFPQSPVRDADIVITSVHKTLPAMTQAALIHISRNCPSADRVRKMLHVFMTSSPSYVLMASIDSMTALLENRAKELFDAYSLRLDDFYGKASRLDNLAVLSRAGLTAKGSHDHDKGKIVVRDTTATYTGEQLRQKLYDPYGLCAEMAAGGYVLLMTSIADTDEAFNRLYEALYEIDRTIPKGSVGHDITFKTRQREICLGMRDAMSGTTEYVPAYLAAGRICGDFVAIYPPGIPELIPGERITAGSVDVIGQALDCGLKVTGLNDGEISVLWEPSST